MSGFFQESTLASQRMPSRENLAELLHKFLTLFGTEGILSNQQLPEHPLQRESSSMTHEGDTVLKKIRPISGNDFHVHPGGMAVSPSWEALLQLSAGDEKAVVQLSRLALQSLAKQDQHEAERRVEQAARLLRKRWPDSSHSPAKRRILPRPFSNDNLPAFQLMRWLAAQEQDAGLEAAGVTIGGASVKELFPVDGALLHKFKGTVRVLLSKQLPQEEWQEWTVARPSTPEPLADANIWSFAGPDFKWVLSLHQIVTILLLMWHPTKSTCALDDNPDRNLSWCLDALQGYCRLRSPHEGSRPLSFSFGTYPDHWMYLHFVLHYFRPTGTDDQSVDDWKGNGIRVERRTFSVPIGPPDNRIKFREGRIWIGMRTATSYNGVGAVELAAPSTVGFVLGDQGHDDTRMTHRRWVDCKLKAIPAAQGIVLFQMHVWWAIKEWKAEWATCIDCLEECHDIELEDLEDTAKLKREWIRDDTGQLSHEYFVTGHVLKSFRRDIHAGRMSIHQMRDAWESTYPPYVDDDVPDTRFGSVERQSLMENWDRLVSFTDELYQLLLDRIEKRAEAIDRLRNNILLERLCMQSMPGNT